jgi:hypothetical protein
MTSGSIIAVGALDADVERDGVPIDAAVESPFASSRLATADS